MVSSKFSNATLILILLIIVPVSCVNNKQNKTRLIAVSCRDYSGKLYYLIMGDTVSSISFDTFKYKDGTYDIGIGSVDTEHSVDCKRTIKKLKDKTFDCRKGHISDELVAGLSTFLSLAKDELNFDSLRGIAFMNEDVFDIEIAISNDFEGHKCEDFHKHVKDFMNKTNLRDKMNAVLKKYNIEVTNIGLDYDGKILNMDTKRCRINGADYGYIGKLPRVLKCMPLRADVKRCPKAQVGSKHSN